MAKIGIFFDTDTGNTRKIAKMIRKLFEADDIELMNIAKATPEDLRRFRALILGTPTLGEGELPEKWAAFLPQLDEVDFSDTTVALFGLGDQEGYPHAFVDGLGLLHEEFEDRGAKLIGKWPLEGYTYDVSGAELDGEFCGLVIDQDNQSALTQGRVETWVEQVKPLLLAAAGESAA